MKKKVKLIIVKEHQESSVQTSRQELHDEVQVPLVLEAVEHLDHPGTIRLHQNIPLCSDVSNLQRHQRKSKILRIQAAERSFILLF